MIDKESWSNFHPHPDYADLPEGIKATLTPKQFAWIDDEGRENLLRDMTQPEVGED